MKRGAESGVEDTTIGKRDCRGMKATQTGARRIYWKKAVRQQFVVVEDGNVKWKFVVW